MAFFKTTFERSNFTFGTSVKQSLDVIFECDVEEENEDNWGELHEAACEAFSLQSNGFHNPAVGVMEKLGTGWSSITGGMTFEKIVIPHIDREIEHPTSERPCIACRFHVRDEKPFAGHVHKYRATGFYRMEQLPPKKRIENPQTNDEIALSIIDEILLEEDEENGRAGTPRFRVIKCLPEEATIISGSGVGGCIIPIKDVVIEGLVEWSDIQIKQAQGKYADRVAKYTNDDIMDDNFQLDREWRVRMAKKLGMLA